MKAKSKPPIIIVLNKKAKEDKNNRPPLPYHNLTTAIPELLSIFCRKDDER